MYIYIYVHTICAAFIHCLVRITREASNKTKPGRPQNSSCLKVGYPKPYGVKRTASCVYPQFWNTGNSHQTARKRNSITITRHGLADSTIWTHTAFWGPFWPENTGVNHFIIICRIKISILVLNGIVQYTRAHKFRCNTMILTVPCHSSGSSGPRDLHIAFAQPALCVATLTPLLAPGDGSFQDWGFHGGTPKSSTLMGYSLTNHPYLGVPPFYGNFPICITYVYYVSL